MQTNKRLKIIGMFRIFLIQYLNINLNIGYTYFKFYLHCLCVTTLKCSTTYEKHYDILCLNLLSISLKWEVVLKSKNTFHVSMAASSLIKVYDVKFYVLDL